MSTERNNWTTKPLHEIADTQLGKMLNKGKQTGEFATPYLRTDNIHWGRFDLSEIKQMDIKPSERENYMARKGDILMCEGGASGRSAIWNHDYEIAFQNHVHRIRPKEDSEILSTYLLYYFEWYIKNGYANHLIKGVTIRSLSQSGLRSIPIVYPSHPEQLRLVGALDDNLSRLDSAVRDIQKAQLRATQFRQSIIQSALNGGL
jgi:type I restriction enzyme S subunit